MRNTNIKPKNTNISTSNICGRMLVVQPYGGGVRHYCPSCDIRQSPGSRFPVIVWTNGSPGTRRFCNNG